MLVRVVLCVCVSQERVLPRTLANEPAQHGEIPTPLKFHWVYTVFDVFTMQLGSNTNILDAFKEVSDLCLAILCSNNNASEGH